MTDRAMLDDGRREHRDALFAAEALEAVTDADAAMVHEIFAGFLGNFVWEHLVVEEMELLPILRSRHGHDALVDRLEEGHAALRAAVGATPAAVGDPAELHRLAELLRHHVEVDERDVYPLVGERDDRLAG